MTDDTPKTVTEMVEKKAKPKAKGTKPKVELVDAEPPEFSDDDLAQRFTRLHGGKLRYTALWGRWHEWKGARWEEDSTLNVFDRARAICRAASSDAD